MRYAIVFFLLFTQAVVHSFGQSKAAAIPVKDCTVIQEQTDSVKAENTATDFEKILKKADFYRGGRVLGIAWDLQVKNIEKGDLRNEISLLVEASAADEKLFALINFINPGKYKGQKLLIRDNNMWFSKPGLRNPVPISSRQRLSGSAANADVASANYFNDYKILSGEAGSLDSTSCWVLDLEAKSRLVSYPRIKYWIAKDTNQGLQAEFFGKSGKLIKTAVFEYENSVSYESQDHAFISKVTISDKINKEDQTVLWISNVRFGEFNSSKFQKNRLLD